jgi:ferritin-like metal-binding protein YciE
MRSLTEAEILSLTAVLKMESDGLAMQRAVGSLISDEDLKRESEASVLATEGRIKGIQQFMNENGVPVGREAR